MEIVWQGMWDAMQPDAVAFVLLGVLLGYVVGVLPGLNRPAALAVAIPLSYYMSPLSAVAFLVGIAKASGVGGATTAILLNTPGEPNAAATCLDGYPMTCAGKGQKALKIALYGSVIGDLLSTLALILVAAPMAKVALDIGPLETTALMLLALTFIAALSGDSLGRGLIAGFAGMLLAMVGLDPETATPRMTFDQVELMDGIPLLAVTVGMLALTEMFIQTQKHFEQRQERVSVPVSCATEDKGFNLREFGEVLPTVLRSSAVGVGIGIVPGLGPTVASFLAYALAKRMARPGDKYGHGDPKGVAAAETADNAVVPASMIPLFALGIPGSVSAAIIIAAFMAHGVTPGPRMFEEHGRLIYGIYGAMLVASILMLVVGRIGLVAFARLTKVPPGIIIPAVTALCVTGAYLENHAVFDVWIMLGFTVLGYVMHRYDYSRVTFLIGFVVGPMFELALRQSLIITQGRLQALAHYPTAIVLLLLALISAVLFARRRQTPSS